MKLITKIIGATLGLAMAIGVGVGVAANNRAATKLDAAESTATWAISASNKLDTSKKTGTFDDSEGNTWTWTSNQNPGNLQDNNTCQQIGAKGSPATVSFSTSDITDVVKSVTVECASYQANHTIAITVGGTSYLAATATPSWTTVGSRSGSGTSTGEIVISFAPGGSARAMYIKSITVVHEPANTPSVSINPASLFFRTGGSSQTVAATATNFSGTVSYSWAHQSGTDCVDLTNPTSATVTMTPKESITEKSTGTYRVTASYNTESATADVSVTVDKGGSLHPYTVAEARAAITSEVGMENAYVRGIICKVESYNSTDNAITYLISDNGINSSVLKVYKGLNIEGQEPFSSKDDLAVSDIVVVRGTLSKYSSDYQANANNRLVSKTSVASIAVKTAPTKVSYNSDEHFDPSGLVVTATYGDATTVDYSYANFSSAFSFDPSTNTALTSQTSVTITLFGQTTTQAISVTVRAITGVTILGDMTNKSYYVGDSWDLTGIYLSVSWNVGTPNPTTVNLTALTLGTEYELDKNAPSKGDTSLYIHGEYGGFAFEKTITGISVVRRPVMDVLRTAATSLNLTESSYNPFSNKTKTLADINSDVTWAGTAACHSGDKALQLNGTSRGIYTTASAGQFIKNVAVDFSDDNDKQLYFYGSNTAYTAVNASIASDENSTLIATLNGNTVSANIAGDYKYVYIYSSGAIYMNSITVTWRFADEDIENSLESKASLAYHYTSDGEGNFSYSDVSIRFSSLINSSLWNRLNNESSIQGYGVMLATPETLGSDPIEDWYAIADGDTYEEKVAYLATGDVKNFYMPLTTKSPDLANSAQKAGAEGDHYIWYLNKIVLDTEEGLTAQQIKAKLTQRYTAVGYIKTAEGLVFLDQATASAAGLADAAIQGGQATASTANGSLKNLADMLA